MKCRKGTEKEGSLFAVQHHEAFFKYGFVGLNYIHTRYPTSDEIDQRGHGLDLNECDGNAGEKYWVQWVWCSTVILRHLWSSAAVYISKRVVSKVAASGFLNLCRFECGI